MKAKEKNRNRNRNWKKRKQIIVSGKPQEVTVLPW